MNTEWQACTIEQAKELKELGIVQKSFWIWQELNPYPGCADKRLQEYFNCGHPISSGVVKAEYAAFNVAELGLMLPFTYNSLNDMRASARYFSGFIVDGVNDYIEYIPNVASRNEAECRANIIIKLIGDSKISVDDINACLEVYL